MHIYSCAHNYLCQSKTHGNCCLAEDFQGSLSFYLSAAGSSSQTGGWLNSVDACTHRHAHSQAFWVSLGPHYLGATSAFGYLKSRDVFVRGPPSSCLILQLSSPFPAPWGAVLRIFVPNVCQAFGRGWLCGKVSMCV